MRHEKPPIYKSRPKPKEKETIERQNNQKAKSETAVVSPYISIITRNVNGIHQPKGTEGMDG